MSAWFRPVAAAALLLAPSVAGAEQPSFSVEGLLELVPGGDDALIPVAGADFGPLHLEARYNYEDPFAGSLWGGWNLGVEGAVSLDATAMAGVVLGSIWGLGVGLELDVSWWWLGLYSEAEQVFDLGDPQGHFFYAWTSLAFYPSDYVWFGGSVQTTVVYGDYSEVDPGPLLGVGWGDLFLEVYWFWPGDPEGFWVVSLGAEF